MPRLYKNAPLAEAVCEVRFDPQTSWDLAIPGLLYEKLKNEFPKRTPLRTYEIQLLPAPDGVQQEAKQSEILQFSDNEDRKLVRVGPNVLSVHNVGSYPGWQQYSPMVEKAIRAYVDVTNAMVFERVGLRYINKIRIPGDQIDLAEFFNFYPNIGKPMPQIHGAYLVGVEFPFEDPEAMLRLQLAAEVTDNPAVHASRLDLDYFNVQPRSVTVENLQEWLQKSHDRVEQVFESAITDKLRVVFDKEEHA